ncbi:D-2-hydroxyacid dehydrogenase [Streptococcus cameli]
MKLKLFNATVEEAAIARKWGIEKGVSIESTQNLLTMEEIPGLEGCHGVVNLQIGQLDKAIYPALKALGIKQIAQRGAGIDMYDLEVATANDIIITNVPSYSPESIAEFALTLALQLIRKTKDISNRVENHNFSWDNSICGRVLGQMTVAILGTGRIGQATAKMFKSIGCRIVGHDLYPSEQMADIIEYKDSVLEAVKEADVISLHMPPSEDNHHLFDQKMFQELKKDAILINTARGALVKTEDLLESLDKGLLAGAGIDTYEFEGPYVPKNWGEKPLEDNAFEALIHHPKVIYTPHVAYFTDEAVKNLVEGALNATFDIVQTGTTQNRVN